MHEWKKGGRASIGLDGPYTLTSPRQSSHSSSRGQSLRLHILQFRFLRPVSLTYRECGIRFRRLILSFFFLFPFSLSLFFPFYSYSFLRLSLLCVLLFFSFSFLSSALLLYLASFLLGFSSLVRFCSSGHGSPISVQLMSLLCVRFFAYRFPFLVRASDTLIRCVVLLNFFYRECWFAYSRDFITTIVWYLSSR